MRVSFATQSQVSEIIHRTLCPTWDQTLIFENVCIYGSPEITEKSPPRVVLELFDRDPVVRVKISLGASDYGIIWGKEADFAAENSETETDFDGDFRVIYNLEMMKNHLKSWEHAKQMVGGISGAILLYKQH